MSVPISTIVSTTVVLVVAAGSVMAQASPASKTAASAPAGPHAYRSAFDGYRPFSDQALVSWREANDLVGRIGGWQAYAREGQAERAASPVKPAASAAHDPAGHKMP